MEGLSLQGGELLLWGYGPFEGWPHNSTIDVTADAAEMLRGSGVRVQRQILEVALEPVRAAVDLVAQGPLPGAVLACGLSGGSDCVEVEMTGHNLADFRGPDLRGHHAKSELLVTGAAPTLEGTVSCPSVLAALAQAQVPARRSDDAGRYLCNAVYFFALDQLGRRGIPVLFLHLPPDRELAERVGGVFPGRDQGLVPMDREVQVRGLAAVGRLLLDGSAAMSDEPVIRGAGPTSQ